MPDELYSVEGAKFRMTDRIQMDEKHAHRFLDLATHRAMQLDFKYDMSEFMTHLLDLYAWNNGIKETEKEE